MTLDIPPISFSLGVLALGFAAGATIAWIFNPRKWRAPLVIYVLAAMLFVGELING